MDQKVTLPPLPLAEWEHSKMTLHLILQIIGKLKLQMMPRKKHGGIRMSMWAPLDLPRKLYPSARVLLK